MQTYTITYIKHEDKVSSRTGKTYSFLSLKTVETGDAWVNGLGNAYTKTKNVGDAIIGDVKEEEYNGRISLKFQSATADSIQAEQIKQLEARIKILENKLGVSVPVVPQAKPVSAFEALPEEASLNDLPF